MAQEGLGDHLPVKGSVFALNCAGFFHDHSDFVLYQGRDIQNSGIGRTPGIGIQLLRSCRASHSVDVPNLLFHVTISLTAAF
jgi:hypothetical protein